MATEIGSDNGKGPVGVALDFSVRDLAVESSPTRVPTRIRERLMEAKSPSTAEEIEAKLRDADIRRQQFYEKLSSKAKQRPRSACNSSSIAEDLAQRLEAKLLAAEQKRLNIMAKEQMRLARIDELRQAAKAGVEVHHKKEKERIGTKVELRVQQAEANRLRILKAHRQRRATLKERTTQTLLRRVARESKYKESIRAALHQKRLAADKKRMGLLEAEQKRACAQVSQARRVANSVSHQREMDRRTMRDQLENRLQRAKRQRAEYLRQRRRQHNYVRVGWNRMHAPAECLSRKLARCWKQFSVLSKTTFCLAKDYNSLKINKNSIKLLPFEQLASLIESSATIGAVERFLDRIEGRFRLSAFQTENPCCLDNIDHLLKRVATPSKRSAPRTSARSREAKKVCVVKSSRYPVRVVLSAYMILCHPDEVFSSRGEREVALAKSAEGFICELELLVKVIIDGPMLNYGDEPEDSMLPKRCSLRSQLAAFDRQWCSYLDCFVVWKVKDAELLEEDLVKAACQLEISMIQKCKLTTAGGGNCCSLTLGLEAIQKGVAENQMLLRDKVRCLTGVAGVERMERALSEARSKCWHSMEDGSPLGSPSARYVTTGTNSSNEGGLSGQDNRSNRSVRSLFREDAAASSSKTKSSPISATTSTHDQLEVENELIVNEFLHQHHGSFIDRLKTTSESENSVQARIGETLKAAFWDGIMESLREEECSYERVIKLVREVRDEFVEMAPKSLKQGINEAIDLDFLTQVLNSGNLDLDYLGNVLEFALATLKKLSSPSQEDDIKIGHQRLLEDLARTRETTQDSKYWHVVATIKGLRFVLEQIQILKKEIRIAHIRMMEPLLKGPSGYDYLTKAFGKRHGSPLNASTSLPLTMQWLSSVNNCSNQEWEEHSNLVASLIQDDYASPSFLPSTVLRTGGHMRAKSSGNGVISSDDKTGHEPQPECDGGKVDLLVRLGLLKLVCHLSASGLTPESVPETFSLNLARLKAIQAEIQKIVVISTSLLVLRQNLLVEQAISNGAQLESLLLNCAKQLSEELETDGSNVGIKEIIEVLSRFSWSSEDAQSEEKSQQVKLIMARMLAKSLQAGDPVFEMVSRAVHLSLRAVVLGGSGHRGRKLCENALRQVCSAMLIDKVLREAEILLLLARVSVSVHRPWYVNLADNLVSNPG